LKYLENENGHAFATSLPCGGVINGVLKAPKFRYYFPIELALKG